MMSVSYKWNITCSYYLLILLTHLLITYLLNTKKYTYVFFNKAYALVYVIFSIL